MKCPSDARHKRTDLSNDAEAINLKKKRIFYKANVLIALEDISIKKLEIFKTYLTSGEYFTSLTTF